jgi:hypothetical protein
MSEDVADSSFKLLQPLRIMGGWTVGKNLFYELDPAPETIKHFFSESCMFSAANQRAGLGIDMHFYPETSTDGEFVIVYSQTDRVRARKREADWTKAEVKCIWKTKSRVQAATEIERFMRDHSWPTNGELANTHTSGC